MALRVGIDLVYVDSVRESLEHHGERYLERVYTAREIADCRHGDVLDVERLAARFAAKEAALKVLRVDDQAVPWQEIEVRREASGWVRLALTGKAATLASEASIGDLALSLSHEHGFASAVVIAEIRAAADN